MKALKQPKKKPGTKINPIRQRIVKRELKKGTDAKNAMLKAGYSPNTAVKSTANGVVKVSQAQILKEFDKSKITVAYILEEFEKAKDLCLQADDRTNLLRVLENLGRHLAMFTDKTEVKGIDNNSLYDEYQRFKQNRLPDIVKDNQEQP